MLNFSPDHLDRHPSVEAYAAAKARIFENQDAGDWAVVNADDPAVLELARRPRGETGISRAASRSPKARRSRTAGSSIAGPDRAERLVPLDAIHLLGPHLVDDVMAAATVGAIAGAAPAAMTAAVDAFRGLEHAMELVADVGGVRFVNDSKATNVEAALRSIESFDAGLVPIIGGRFKGGDLRLLRAPLASRAQGGRRDRRGAAAASRGARRRRGRAGGGLVRRSRAERHSRRRSRRAWCCSRRRARASTCSGTTRNAGVDLKRKWKMKLKSTLTCSRSAFGLVALPALCER